MSALGFSDNSYEIKNPDFFETFQEAMAWAKSNLGKSITRAADGHGYKKMSENNYESYIFNVYGILRCW